MENLNGLVPDIPIQEQKDNATASENFGRSVDEMVGKVDQVTWCWGKLYTWLWYASWHPNG